MRHNFNDDISNWDVSKVTDMNVLFMGAASFNSNISKWDLARVTDMNRMFKDAILFNQQLCGDAWAHSMAS